MVKTYLHTGSIIDGRWEVVQLIGRGGMANVYLVRDARLHQYWALKEVPYNNTPEGKIKLESVFAETNLLRSLSHKSIPRIIDVLRTNKSLLIVMDYVSGRSLREVIGEQQYIDEKYIIRWGKSLCKTLQYLHNHYPKVIYRDMKPHNVMLNNDGEIVLLDFGISRAITPDYDTSATKRLGTKGYSAPEQAGKVPWFDERSDIFALGRTLYFLASNHNPSDSPEKIRPIREWDSRRSVGLEKIIEKATQTDPKNRYQRVEEMLYDLEHIHELSSEHVAQVKRRFRTLVTLGSCLVLGSFLLGGGVLYEKLDSMNKFDTFLETGKTTGNIESLVQASQLNPSAVEPYMELVKLYKDDNEFTLREEVQLQGLLQPNLSQIRGKEGAGDLLYQIGQLYWYYYTDNGQIKSVSWFEQAKSYGVSKENELLLSVYLDIGLFKKGILTSITEQSDTGMYKEYWEALSRLKSVMEGDVKLELLYLQSMFDLIDTYSGGLKTDGYSREDLLAVFDEAVSGLSLVEPRTDKEVAQVEGLKSRIETVKTKLDTTYGIRF